ncbi:Deoxyribodipyrimidine photolyase [Klebsiella michiganensis]|uniref:Deoxyribodipyrimidine photolyase n=1 Tax=Klebsiella michiganensis TaxID=1134687 RepID=A0A7H4N4H3_9ENTR|nr:Deoxyribodipyrimidine photolyase [Klebsiella michiganensis]
MATHLVWFRADLRIHDNLALAAACRDPDAEVLGLFYRHAWAMAPARYGAAPGGVYGQPPSQPASGAGRKGDPAAD